MLQFSASVVVVYVPISVAEVVSHLLSQRKGIDIKLASHAQSLSVCQCVRILPAEIQVVKHLIWFTSGLANRCDGAGGQQTDAMLLGEHVSCTVCHAVHMHLAVTCPRSSGVVSSICIGFSCFRKESGQRHHTTRNKAKQQQQRSNKNTDLFICKIQEKAQCPKKPQHAWVHEQQHTPAPNNEIKQNKQM